MKILVTGSYSSSIIYESALEAGFRCLGNEVASFPWAPYLDVHCNRLGRFVKYIQGKLVNGPIVAKLNRDLIHKVKVFRPDFVFIYRGTHILSDTIQKIGQLCVIVFGYSNDDPFGNSAHRYYWRHFVASCFSYDWLFAYRPKNVLDYQKRGVTNTSLLMPYYIRNRNFPIKSISTDKYCCDVIFLGHFDNRDQRDEYIKSIIKAGIHIELMDIPGKNRKTTNFSRDILVGKYGSWEAITIWLSTAQK